MLLVTSGVHGVEAYSGSAAQLAALAAPPQPPADGALVLVHVVNPYGMAWLRRANESNVDLNRNFLGPGERYEGAPALYARLDPLLNPPSPPASDGFLARLALFGLRHGLRATRQAIAQGQYEYPRGLFYGGTALEAGPARLLDWLRRNLARAEYVFALDLHTGLGPWGKQTLILEPGVAATPATELARALGARLVDPAAGGAPYTIRGGMGGALPRALVGARVDFVLQEIGTYSALRVIHALREENRWHLHGGGSPEHPAKRALLEALCPGDPRWRERALALATGALAAAARFAFGRQL